MRAFRRDLLARGALRGVAIGAAVAACGLLAARAFLSPLPPAAFAMFAAVPICALACALFALRRAPSRAMCLALVEDASHAGGLILSKDVPGAEKWPRPVPAAPYVPSTWRRAIPGAIAALAALAAVAAAPDDWFAAGAPQPPAPAFPAVTTEIKNELATVSPTYAAELRTEGFGEGLQDVFERRADILEGVLNGIDTADWDPAVDPALPANYSAADRAGKAACKKALQEELDRIEKEADPSAPGETLDAVDAVREKLDALLDMNAEAAKHLLPENNTFASLATLTNGAEQLKKMLEESSEGRCPHCGRKLGEGEDECSGDCCACEESKDGDGDGDSHGSGGVSRGRDDAPLDFGDETQLGASKLKDLAEKAGLAGNPSVTKVGESISNEDPAKRGVSSSPGARRAIGGRSQGASAGQNVLPRHRGTVKRFFDIERKAP